MKITILGAGSGFTQTICTDILNIEGLDGGVLALVDTDKRRLDVNMPLIEKIIALMGKSKSWRVEASTDRRAVMNDSDYIISFIEVSGLQSIKHEYEIPLKYGIDQCVGDTIGPGGVMKALRTWPSLHGILEDAKKLCPKALILNYTNPMSMLTLAATRSTDQQFLGLCHSVQGNSKQIALLLDIPYDELVWNCGGINHMSWFTELRWKGEDLLPALVELCHRPDIIEEIPIRADLVRELGYFSTEGCGHFSEYVPYYRKNPEILKQCCRPGHLGGSGYRLDMWPTERAAVDKRREEMISGKRAIQLNRGHEYAASIIEAYSLNRLTKIYASVPNCGLIENLPQTGVVEVGIAIDHSGCHPLHFGSLPEQCAALCRSNMAVFELTVQGLLNHDREAIIHAMMLDPLSAAVCSTGQIRTMAEELFITEKTLIPEWCNTKPPRKKSFLSLQKPRTPFVKTLDVSKLMPQASLDKTGYPENMDRLDFKQRSFSGSGSFCDMHQELDSAGKCLVYFRSRFSCSENMTLRALVGYDGPVKIWFDGREVFFDGNGRNPAIRDGARIEISASKNDHELLIALDSNSGLAWGIFLRYERTDVKEGDISAEMPKVEGTRYDALDEVSEMAAKVSK